MKCDFKYAIDFIFIRSNWFDQGGKFKVIGDKAFYLYLNMFRFLVNNQSHKYTFYTSIDMLRKATGYSGNEIFALIRLLHKEKVIDTNSKWGRWFVDDKLNGELKDHAFIVIQAIASPNIKWEDGAGKKGKYVPVTDSPDDKYVSVDLRLMQLYQNKKLNEKFYPMFCLINKRSNNTESKMWMKINNMARDLGFGDSTVSHVIRELNRNYLMVSSLRDNGKGDKLFEHKICNNIDRLKAYQEGWIKELIDKNIKKWDKPKKRKSSPKNKITTKPVDDIFVLDENEEVDIIPGNDPFETDVFNEDDDPFGESYEEINVI